MAIFLVIGQIFFCCVLFAANLPPAPPARRPYYCPSDTRNRSSAHLYQSLIVPWRVPWAGPGRHAGDLNDLDVAQPSAVIDVTITGGRGRRA
jgi:hypothetical protein